MKGTVWQRCTSCRRKVNGTDARKRHKASGCTGSGATWALKADLGRDATGRRRQQVRAGFDTEAEANRKLRELLSKVDGGRYVEPSKRTVGDYLEGEWLPATAPPKVTHGTYGKRRLHVVRYVVPRIGTIALAAVNGATLDQLYADLVREGGRDGAPLAASTVRDVHRTLHKAFADARRWQLLERNPCEEAEPPRMDRVAEDARAALHAWTGQELRTFLSATADHRLGPVYYLAASTGMRRSEVLGLRWSDLDLTAGTLRVAQKLVRGADGYELRLSTKTTAGARTVALDGSTVDLLRRHKVRQAEARLAAGSAWVDLGLVFTREDGTPIPPEAVSQAFRRAVRGADVPPIRFHDVRHTHATLLLQAGEPVKVVSERLGHASPTITLTIYAHVLPGMQKDAAATFGRLLAGEEG
jgi:integrase